MLSSVSQSSMLVNADTAIVKAGTTNCVEEQPRRYCKPFTASLQVGFLRKNVRHLEFQRADALGHESKPNLVRT